jgi:hypothetical protein
MVPNVPYMKEVITGVCFFVANSGSLVVYFSQRAYLVISGADLNHQFEIVYRTKKPRDKAAAAAAAAAKSKRANKIGLAPPIEGDDDRRGRRSQPRDSPSLVSSSERVLTNKEQEAAKLIAGRYLRETPRATEDLIVLIDYLRGVAVDNEMRRDMSSFLEATPSCIRDNEGGNGNGNGNGEGSRDGRGGDSSRRAALVSAAGAEVLGIGSAPRFPLLAADRMSRHSREPSIQSVSAANSRRMPSTASPRHVAAGMMGTTASDHLDSDTSPHRADDRAYTGSILMVAGGSVSYVRDAALRSMEGDEEEGGDRDKERREESGESERGERRRGKRSGTTST